MLPKLLHRLLSTLLLLLSSISCAGTHLGTSCTQQHMVTTTTDASVVPVTAFVLLSKHSIYIRDRCSPKERDKNGLCKVDEDDYNASGVFVYRSHAVQTIGFMATARHFCEFKSYDAPDITAYKTFSAVDYYGISHRAEVYFTSTKADVCIMLIRDMNDQIGLVRISSRYPHVGARVYSMSAPGSYFVSKTVLLFEGLFSGLRAVDDVTVAVYTVPVASGASGGGIFDQDGDLIGLVSGQPLYRRHGDPTPRPILETITVAAPLDVISAAVDSIDTMDNIFGQTLTSTTTSHQ